MLFSVMKLFISIGMENVRNLENMLFCIFQAIGNILNLQQKTIECKG